MYQRAFRRAEQTLARKLEQPSPLAGVDHERAARAIDAQFENRGAVAMFAEALLGAGRLEEGIEEYRRGNVPLPPDVLRSFGDRFLTEGDFDRAAAYYRAAGGKIEREQYARHWVAFLARTDSVEAILLHCQNLNLPFPVDKLNAIGDRVLPDAATADYVRLTHAFWAYEAAGASAKLIQLGDRCRSRQSMNREMTDLVVAMYEAAGAKTKILEVARSLEPWADLAYLRDLCTMAGTPPSPNDLIAFGVMKERAGSFDEAIDAFREAGASSQLRDLAQHVIDREQTTVGRMGLSAESRRIAVKAFSAIASLEHRLAA